MAIITLSRKPFSGTKELAKCLEIHLGYKLISREDVIEKIEQYGMPRDRMDNARRKSLGRLPRLDLNWMHYIAYVRATLSKEIREGNLIYLGNNGQQLLRGYPNLVNVGVITEVPYRVNELIKRNEYVINKKTARQMIEKMDERGYKWGRTIYADGKHDPSEFDVVIDPALMSIDEACEIVQAAVERPQFLTTPESLQTVEQMAVAAELRARIAMEPQIVDDKVEVEARDGLIFIEGWVHSSEDLEAIVGLFEDSQR